MKISFREFKKKQQWNFVEQRLFNRIDQHLVMFNKRMFTHRQLFVEHFLVERVTLFENQKSTFFRI